MNRKFTCIFDFDTTLYGAAVLCEDRYIVATHRKSGKKKEFPNVSTFWGRSKKTVGGWLGEQPFAYKREDFDVEHFVRRNKIPLKNAKEFIFTNFEKIKNKEWCKDLKLVVGGTPNYRYNLYPLYKANRPEKPLIFQELKDWFLKEFSDYTIVADGVEADDVLSIYGHWGVNRQEDPQDSEICLIYIDKDIDQVVGWKYNPNKDEIPLWNDEISAARCFWSQMLQGDNSDNIPGLENTTPEMWQKYNLRGQKYGVGAGNSLTLLSDCDTVQCMEERVKKLYEDYYHHLWKKKFQLNYQLLKLCEKKGEIPEYKF